MRQCVVDGIDITVEIDIHQITILTHHIVPTHEQQLKRMHTRQTGLHLLLESGELCKRSGQTGVKKQSVHPLANAHT
jgi:hypothetical protein